MRQRLLRIDVYHFRRPSPSVVWMQSLGRVQIMLLKQRSVWSHNRKQCPANVISSNIFPDIAEALVTQQV